MSVKIHFYLFLFLAYMYMIGKLEIFLIFYISILIHEIAHVVMALILKIDVVEINLMPVGVSAIYAKRIKPLKEVLISIAGPLMSLFLAIFSKDSFVSNVNLLIMFFNLIPIYPLDGGRIFKIFLIHKYKTEKGLKISQFFSDLFIIVLFGISIILVIYLKNFNLIILTFYIMFLSKEEKKKERILRIINYLQTEE